jgi:predicted TIM-barrel fold metal-dependent hydrolase
MFNVFYSHEQLDYLSYVLETYPNVYLDLGGRIKDFYSMDREHLRSFIIKYAHRILFGTDFGHNLERADSLEVAKRHHRSFQAFESDSVIPARNERAKPYRGLTLPVDVLEKIYFRNAVKIYPRIRTVLQSRGYRD